MPVRLLALTSDPRWGHNRWSLACFIWTVQSGKASQPYQHSPTTLATLQIEGDTWVANSLPGQLPKMGMFQPGGVYQIVRSSKVAAVQPSSTYTGLKLGLYHGAGHRQDAFFVVSSRLCAVNPSRLQHIGGDSANVKAWRIFQRTACPWWIRGCQSRCCTSVQGYPAQSF